MLTSPEAIGMVERMREKEKWRFEGKKASFGSFLRILSFEHVMVEFKARACVVCTKSSFGK
jgi:hypothetical protein